MYDPIKVIALDVFGTVVDMSSASRDEIRNYVQQLRQPEWLPLTLPESWEHFPAYPDAAEGLRRLRENFFVCTCSNAPLGMCARLSKNAGLEWDAIIPLELNRVYKTDPRAYMTVCEVLNVKPQEVMMVTANESFGDLEASESLGMAPMLIRCDHGYKGDVGPKTLIELADVMQTC